MSNTGYIIKRYQDTNPKSPTFLEYKEEKEYNTGACPLGTANWVFVSESCDVDENGAQNGYVIVEEVDMNPASSTYLNSRYNRVYNPTACPSSDTEPEWYEMSRACELTDYNGTEGNTGYVLIELEDINPYSPTYEEVVIERVEDGLNCPAPNTEPEWQVLSADCVVVTVGGGIGFNGTQKVRSRDINPLSNTYLQEKEEIIDNPTACPTTNTEPEWVEIGRECAKITYMPGNVEGNNGVLIIYEENKNPLSNTFGQIITQQINDYQTCPLPDKTPNIQVISTECILINNKNNGKQKLIKSDINKYSETYGTITEEIIDNLIDCPIPIEPTVNKMYIQTNNTDITNIFLFDYNTDVSTLLNDTAVYEAVLAYPNNPTMWEIRIPTYVNRFDSIRLEKFENEQIDIFYNHQNNWYKAGSTALELDTIKII